MKNKIFLGHDFISTTLSLVDLKTAMTNEVTKQYLMRAMMSGALVCFLYVCYYAIVNGFAHIPAGMDGNLKGLGKFIGSAFFGFALVFIYFSKSELLTSNMMIVCIGRYYKRMTRNNFWRVLLLCYLGNFLGGLFVGITVWLSTIMSPEMIHLMDESIAAKEGFISAGISGHMDLLIRAMYCNFFINLAMLTVYSGNIANDFTKVVTMMGAVFIFVYLGLEHSIANTVLFTMGAFVTDVNFGLAAANIAYALLGNFIGGGVMIGVYYSYINDEERWARKRGIQTESKGDSEEL